MYGQGHHQNHNAFLNGGHGNQRFGIPMNSSKPFQGGHQGQPPRSQQDHMGHHQANVINHQHNSSTSGFSVSTPNFTPAQLRNPTPGNMQNGADGPLRSDHWSRQLEKANKSRAASDKHHWAKNSNTGKTLPNTGIENQAQDIEQEERNRAVSTKNTDSITQQWDALDMSGLGLQIVSRATFGYPFLKKLYLNNNKLSLLPPEIGLLRNLVHLDVSGNDLRELPAELGMLVNLKELWAFNNHLQDLPPEMGSLFQIEMLGLDGNPLDEQYRTILIQQGSKELIAVLRENGGEPEPPNDREIRTISEAKTVSGNGAPETFSVMSYNTLCDKYATQTQYGYTPQYVLAWENRRSIILQELLGRDADVLCLQEIDTESYHDFFRPSLARQDYRGVFWPKTRAKTMADKEAKSVDGCAIFYKNHKFVLLDKQLIDFAATAIQRPDMKGEHNVFNRVMTRDNIAVVTFLENRQTGARMMVANAHIHWDPVYRDVKVVQVAILMEQISKMAETFSKHQPCKDKSLYRFSEADADEESTKMSPPPEPAPSQEYPNGAAIPLILCGDFNSTQDSGVYELISKGSLAGSHPDLCERTYGNFTRNGMSHPFQLRSAYGSIEELSFTNYTPGFTGVIDYIFYSSNALQVVELLGEVDEDYLQRVPGFPNAHFPSDHLALLAKFAMRQRKDRQKTVEGERRGREAGSPATAE